MKALTDKMEAVNLSLIVECFELNDEFPKGKFSFFEARKGDGALVDDSDAKNELAEVFIVLVGEDAVEDARAKAVDVQE